MNPEAKLSVRCRPGNANHHLWNNHGTFWCHLTKECDQCRSIAYKRTGVCPFCGTYRFKEAPERVRATAYEMLTHPYPVTAGAVPRLREDADKIPPLLVGHEGPRWGCDEQDSETRRARCA